MIDASDNPLGVFSFLTASLTLSGDGPVMGELEVQRTLSQTERVSIMWEALYTDGEQHPVPVEDILVTTQGTIVFPDGSATPEPSSRIILQLRPDLVSDSVSRFVYSLTSAFSACRF